MAITLKAARVNAGYTQTQAAKALGISKNTLVSYENGRACPRIITAQEIAKLYNTTINDIIFLPVNCT